MNWAMSGSLHASVIHDASPSSGTRRTTPSAARGGSGAITGTKSGTRSGGGRGELGRVRDLARDLDDVPVRVEDAQLPVGAVPAREDRAHALELRLRAELARVRLDVAQRGAGELGERDTVPPAGCEVHHRRLEPVACAEPLVLGREDPVVRRDLAACVVLLAVQLDERLAERGERDGVLDMRDRVAHADLDRPEPG